MLMLEEEQGQQRWDEKQSLKDSEEEDETRELTGRDLTNTIEKDSRKQRIAKKPLLLSRSEDGQGGDTA